MKYTKKLLSVLLAIVLIFTMSIGAFAAEGDPNLLLSADKTKVENGETVTLTVGHDAAINGVVGENIEITVDTDVFELVSYEVADSRYVVSDKLASKKIIGLDCTDLNFEGYDLPAGTVATFVFKAIAEKENVKFSAKVEAYDVNIADIVINAPTAVSVTVAEKAPAPTFTGYAVYGGTDVSAATGDEVTVNLFVTHSDTENVTTYNAYDVTVEYNAEELQFVSYTAPIGDESHANYTNKVQETKGTLQFAGFGEHKEFNNPVGTLKFKVLKAGGEAVLNILSPKISNQAESIDELAPEVEIAGGEDSTADEIVVNVAHKVTKPDFVTGDATVAPGADYTFSYTDTENYTYSELIVTVDGTPVTPTENADGSYTIENVNGNIVITATQTANSYDVAFTEVESVTYEGADKATYGTDYTVKVTTSKTGYKVGTVKATIDGEEIVLTSGDNNVYTLAGDKIKGDIEITATVVNAGTHTLVIFTGNGAEDVADGTEQIAEIGKAFTFKLKDTVESGWKYTATIGEEEITPNNNGEYTIAKEKVTAEGVTVAITKVQVTETAIEVAEYITLGATTEAEGRKIYLVKATKDESVLAYDESTMFWSAKYNAYCWLVISDKSAEEVLAEAETKVVTAAEDASATAIAYDMDVNQSTGNADINDAQIVYDMYTAEYDSFETVSMDKFLEADTNGDTKVDTADAVAIVNHILGITENA